jgi:hypothetical protein
MTTTVDGSESLFFSASFFFWHFESQLFELPDECPDELLPDDELESDSSSPDELLPEELLPEEPPLPDELLPDELLPEVHDVRYKSYANACGLPNRVAEAKRTAVAPSIRAIFIVPPEDSRRARRLTRWSDTVRSILSIGNGRGNREW